MIALYDVSSQKMSSREISQIIGKKHSHLMRDIRNMEVAWEKIGRTKFVLTYYTDSFNRKQPEYMLSKTECLYVATKCNDEARACLVTRWEQLEINKKKGGFSIPQTFSEALELAAKQTRTIESQQLQLEIQQPKVKFAEAVSDSKTCILIGELAKILKQNGINIGQNRLFEWLRNNGYLISREGTDRNMPTQRAMELKIFEIKESVIRHSSGFTTINKTVKVNGKGQTYFIKKFLSQN